MQPQRSLSCPTPPLQPQLQQQNPNARVRSNKRSGAEILALLRSFPLPPIDPVRMASSNVPKGRRILGVHTFYDVDLRLPGEVQPQLEGTPITKYTSDPQLCLGRQIAVNKSYICYGLKQGNIRVLSINTAPRSLFRTQSQRVTDMVFFAEDVHLLASAGIDGRFNVWKISEGPDDEDKPQITGKTVISIQIVGEEEIKNIRICWHCCKQEILVVGVGKRILKIDTNKVGKCGTYTPEAPLQCPFDKLADGIQLVGKHDGEVTDLSMCGRMTTRLVSSSMDGTIKIWEDLKSSPPVVLRPHDGLPVYSASFLTASERPDHIILITAGPQNRELKIWVSREDTGSLICMQTLELKSSAEPRAVEAAFFNQVVALSQVGLLLLANAKRNAIYAIHLNYGPYPAASRMDYISEFTVTTPILSLTVTSDVLHGQSVAQIYCVQTQAIQQYTLDLCQCFPSQLENVGFEKLDTDAAQDALKKGKGTQVPGLSSPSPSASIFTDSSSETTGPASRPSLESAMPQIVAMQEMLNQLVSTQKEMQKQMSNLVSVPVSKEYKKLEAALGRSIEKTLKENTDALWACFEEENSKNEKLLRDRTQKITTLVSNFVTKDLPAILEKALKKESASVAQTVAQTLAPVIEKTISSAIVETFQRGVGDKAVNQLEKSINSKLEATVAREIQAQFQTSGKQALQEALKTGLEASVVLAFEMSCKAMFEQVDATFRRGMIEHTTAALQHFESTHSSLALALSGAINSASSLTQSLSGELAESQRKMLALVAAPGAANPLVSQLSIWPLAGLHEKVETHLDLTKELSRLISERKYDEAFTIALERSDVGIVSWLCSQVDMQGILAMHPLPLSQGVLLSLLQQLACDISKDTDRKLAWMTDVAAAINPADQMISMQARPIFEEVYQILQDHRSFPTISGAIRVLIHVINSMRLTCK